MLDTVTILCSVLLLLIGLLAPMASPFFRSRRILSLLKSQSREEKPSQEALGSLPPLTVLLTAHHNAAELERNLPAILDQNYPAGYRIVVVADRDDSDTVDVLKRFADRLSYTLLPDSSRYISRKKLAVTIGVKAAETEWILLTAPGCCPVGDQWLSTMAQAATDERSLVVGYTAFDEATSAYRRFERLNTAFYLMREDLTGTAYRTCGLNLMFRRSVFMQGEGYRGNLELIRGEYDFLVNKYATRDNTALVLSPEGWMMEQTPTDKSWHNRHLYYLASRPLLKRSFVHRLRFNSDQIILHASLWLLLAGGILATVLHQWIIAGAAVVSLLLTILLNDIIGARAIRPFDKNLPIWNIYFRRLTVVWHNLANALRFLRADKLDFTTHKQ